MEDTRKLIDRVIALVTKNTYSANGAISVLDAAKALIFAESEAEAGRSLLEAGVIDRKRS